ncbi:hypothetical protein [Streptomyces sp. bgisy130]|uniref:hypothetical protein n=1 Tax=Streptomyces sp. bgisy130 TaxID=3413788 RepID=UPI003F4A0DB7
MTRTSNSVTALAVGTVPALRFSVPLSATRRGARLARLLATEQLRAWGLPFELADRWGVEEGPVPCKTVWAEVDLGAGG